MFNIFYVYSRHIPTGKERYIDQFETERAAVIHIAKCYRIDAEIGQTGEYYYFIKKR